MAKKFKRRDSAGTVLSPAAASLTLTPTSPTVTNLGHLIELLKKIAADCASDERLTKKERKLWIRQGEIFSTSVAELDAILTDHQYENAREQLLCKLFKASSACFIAARVEENHSKTVPATNAQKKLTKIVVEEAEKVWRKHPTWREHWHEHLGRVVGLIEKSVNERVKAEVRPLSRGAKQRIAEGRPVLSRRAIKERLRRWLSTTHDRTIVQLVRHDRSIVSMK